jgi:hypothetical protein
LRGRWAAAHLPRDEGQRGYSLEDATAVIRFSGSEYIERCLLFARQ